MIGDIITLKPEYNIPAEEIGEKILNHISDYKTYIISIAGESGSGKSTLSVTLKAFLEQQNLNVLIFHMDDYFHLPPKDNHAERELNIGRIGPSEVNLNLLQTHIENITLKQLPFEKPLVHYQKNMIDKEVIDHKEINVVIVEGTYVHELQNVDLRVFIDRTYIQTKENRFERSRDLLNAFNEQVLSLEHMIIKEYKNQSDVIVSSDFTVEFIEF